jgi:hypothetical protein
MLEIAGIEAFIEVFRCIDIFIMGIIDILIRPGIFKLPEMEEFIVFVHL